MAKRTLRDPVNPKTMKMIINCLFDSIPHFDFSRSEYKRLYLSRLLICEANSSPIRSCASRVAAPI